MSTDAPAEHAASRGTAPCWPDHVETALYRTPLQAALSRGRERCLRILSGWPKLPERLRSVGSVFVMIVVLQLVLAALSIGILSTVRAYVAGESLYSKGQKDALLHLEAYVQSHNDTDYQLFLQALSVPEGDARARRAMQQDEPDLDAARAGFLAGQNHPDDIEGLIRLFIWAHDVPFMARAIKVWSEGDTALTELRTQVERARERIRAGDLDATDVRLLPTLVPRWNPRLTQMERDFSDELGKASRLVQKLLLGLNLLTSGALAFTGGRYIRRTLRAQRQRETEMMDLVRGVGDGLLTVDGEHRVVLFNRAAEQLFGCTAAEAKGMPVARFIEGGMSHRDIPIAPIAPGTAESVHELKGRHTSGRALFLEASLAPLHTAQGRHTTIVCRDVTERHEAREQERSQLLQRNAELTRKANTDALTGLPNREALTHHLEDALVAAQRGGAPFSVLFLDLDGFKAVNDTHGHLGGDELLRQVATRLREAVRRQDEVFRVSGDEFVVAVADDVDTQASEILAQRVLAAVRQPYLLGDATAHITVSVGVAHYPDNGDDARSLLLAADASMYRAKQSGKNSYHVGAPSVHITRERPALVHELERAIAHDELELHYQPIVNANDTALVGAEALVRWRHPTQGLLRPDAFIPLAEAHGLCSALGDWVIQRALGELAAAGQLGPAWVNVNLAASQLSNPNLPQDVARLLQRFNVPATRLGIELTESMGIHDAAMGHAILHSLREMGVCVCLDDFGTGYSSLSHLHCMPVDKLKIDRSFVEHLPRDASALRIVEAIQAMSHAMRLKVVAEGVENAEQARTLRVLGVDEFQGFGIARPMPWEQLQTFVIAWRSGALDDTAWSDGPRSSRSPYNPFVIGE